jgi:hypothetical protein
MANRAKAEAVILQHIESLCPDSPNTEFYKNYFSSLSDKAFGEYIAKLKAKTMKLHVTIPNGAPYALNVRRVLDLCEGIGLQVRQRIWLTDPDTGVRYLSSIAYVIVDWAVRRQAQVLEKKASIPLHNRSVDTLTGQATGDSKGAKISNMETVVLSSLGLETHLSEFMKARGGDKGMFNAMNESIIRQGAVSLASIEHLSTGVQAKDALHVMLTSAHLRTTLKQG